MADTHNQTTPQFFIATRDVWDAMLSDCERATRSIELDLYILGNDEIGQRFMDLFIKKAKAGVRVHLLLDHIGSYNLYSSPKVTELIAAGGHVQFYNELSRHKWFVPARWFPRNHVKSLLIDSDIAFVGSACIRADMAEWRDTTLRLTGPDVAGIEKQFAYARLVWWKRYGTKREFRRETRTGQNPYTYFVHRPSMGFNPIYRTMIRAVSQAKHSICITTPYFLAPYVLRRALRRATARGVDVRILMNERSDARIADLVSQSYFHRLMKKNVKIFLYQKFMLHTKCIIIDDDWASLGSTNIDYLSLHVNREANLFIRDKAQVAILREHFENDLKSAVLAERRYWKNRPIWERLLGYAGRSIKGIL